MSVGPRTSGRRYGFWLRIALVFAAMVAVALAVLWGMWIGWAPSRDTYPIQGILVSSRQEAIDWRGVRTTGADFAYIRATHGTEERDVRFTDNWTGARKAGLRYGAQLDYDPCERAGEQATLYITTVPRDNAALPPAIRLDLPPHCAPPPRDSILSELNTVINLVEAHSGTQAIIHVSPAFEAAYDIAGSINRTFWLDRNFFPPDYSDRPWVMWTASDARRIEGVSGPVSWIAVAP